MPIVHEFSYTLLQPCVKGAGERRFVYIAGMGCEILKKYGFQVFLLTKPTWKTVQIGSDYKTLYQVAFLSYL